MHCRAAYSPRLKPIWAWVTGSRAVRRVLSTSSARRVEQKPYFITTPIFYPNSGSKSSYNLKLRQSLSYAPEPVDPHLGHLYSTVLADIFARYSKLKTPSRPVLFVTGTDEHGSKIEKAARTAGLEGREKEFCDAISARFQELSRRSDISQTRFIRTTEPEHIAAVQHLWCELKSKGYLYKGTHRGWYSTSDEAFYTDSQVVPAIHPKTRRKYMIAKESRSIVEWTEEENYKFRLSEFRDSLLERYSANPTAVVPFEQHDLVLRLLRMPENVADLSVSRPSARLKWGIPVPNDPGHTIYVWLDALTAYLTAGGYPWKDQKSSCNWPPDVQIIGKDILRFHAIYFPAFLMALDLPLPQTIISHGHITVNQKKMSKSVGNTANPFAILEKYGSDVVRFYLTRIGGRYNSDKDWAELQLRKHYKELFSSVGNLLTRSFTPVIIARLPESERYISTKPEIFMGGPGDSDDDPDTFQRKHIHSSLQNVVDGYEYHMDRLEIAQALEIILKGLGSVNREFTALAPWARTSDVKDLSLLLSYIRETLRISGILMQPFIPSKAQVLLDFLGVPGDRRTLIDAQLGRGELPGDAKVAVKPFKLFETVRFHPEPESKSPWMEFENPS